MTEPNQQDDLTVGKLEKIFEGFKSNKQFSSNTKICVMERWQDEILNIKEVKYNFEEDKIILY